MPTYFNNTLIKNATFNGQNLSKIYFNNALVFSKTLEIKIYNAWSNGHDKWGYYGSIQKLIREKRKYNETEIIIHVVPGARIPRLIGDQWITSAGITKITLINEGVIQAGAPSGSAMWIHPKCHIHLDNRGTFEGGGGNGGAGWKGNKGNKGNDKTVSTPRSQWTSETRKFNGSVNRAYMYDGYLEGIAGWVCDRAWWMGKKGNQFCAGKTGTVPGYPGSFTRGTKKYHDFHVNGGRWNGYVMNIYDVVRSYTKKWVDKKFYRGGEGGEGGAGGAGGVGWHYGSTAETRKGKEGLGGKPGKASVPAGGNSGGWGLKGNHGGDGGWAGEPGHKGWPNGNGGGPAGNSIEGINHCTIINRGKLLGKTTNT